MHDDRAATGIGRDGPLTLEEPQDPGRWRQSGPVMSSVSPGLCTDLLGGKILWEGPAGGVQADAHTLVGGSVEVYAERTLGQAGSTRCLYHDGPTGVSCALIGYVTNVGPLSREAGVQEADDVGSVVAGFQRAGVDFLQRLEGVFSLFLWDEPHKRGYLLQDEYGSNTPLYYCCLGPGFHFGTSLKWLLPRTHNQRVLNRAAVANFLHDGRIVPNEMTLIEKIYKMVPGTYLAIAGQQRSVQVCPREERAGRVSRQYAKRRLLPCIETLVSNLLGTVTAQRFACSLSGGFDSTLLFSLVAGHTEPARVIAVTIGGREINEIPQAQRTVGFHPGVTHLHEVVAPDLLDFLPDMVWRLEGYVFEEGIFLQYQMARLLAARGLSVIFLGDGADQQLDRYRFTPRKRWETAVKKILQRTPVADLYCHCLGKTSARPFRDARLRHRFRRARAAALTDPLLDVILKKNGLMLHSFGIRGMYPFLSRELRQLCEALGRLNEDKRFYRDAIARFLGRDRTEHLVKIGGQTDIGYLMKDRLPLLLRCLETEPVRSILTEKEIQEVKTPAAATLRSDPATCVPAPVSRAVPQRQV